MRTFHFTLDRMRSFKIQLLDKEKNFLRNLRLHKDKIEEKIQSLQLHLSEQEAEFQVKQTAGMSAQETSSYGFILENTRLQLEHLYKERAKAAAEVERQLKVVVSASQEVSSLDKLEEKQWEVYHQLVSKDNELMISEFVSMQYIKQKSGMMEQVM